MSVLFGSESSVDFFELVVITRALYTACGSIDIMLHRV